MRRFLCAWIGHRYPIEATIHDRVNCLRCGQSVCMAENDNPPGMIRSTWVWLTLYRQIDGDGWLRVFPPYQAMRRFICAWLGHRHPPHAAYYDWRECLRCGRLVSKADNPLGLIRCTWYWLKQFPLYQACRRCQFCNKRFCGNPDDDDHLPF